MCGVNFEYNRIGMSGYKGICIKELNENDNLDNYLEMVNDLENVKGITGLGSKNLTKEDLIDFIKNYDGYLFGIFDKNDNHVGNIGLNSINKDDKSCSIGVLISRKFQRKGYAFTGIKKVIKFVFEYLNLKMVTLDVLEWNIPAIKLYEKIGFKFDSFLKKGFTYRGKLHNLRKYSIMKNQFHY